MVDLFVLLVTCMGDTYAILETESEVFGSRSLSLDADCDLPLSYLFCLGDSDLAGLASLLSFRSGCLSLLPSRRASLLRDLSRPLES